MKIQEQISNPSMVYIEGTKKRIVKDIYDSEKLKNRGFFAITKEDARRLRELFSRKLDNNFSERYETFCVPQRYSARDHSILLRVAKNYDSEKEPFLIVEPLSGGMTISKKEDGSLANTNVYTALILVNNRVEPKYTYKLIIDYGHSKSCTYTLAHYIIETPLKKFEWVGQIINDSPRHTDYYLIGIMEPKKTFCSVQYRNTSCNNVYFTEKCQ